MADDLVITPTDAVVVTASETAPVVVDATGDTVVIGTAGRFDSYVGPTINVVADFKAVGDGVADDWEAIENARRMLISLGGGRLYFPRGRYRMPTFAKNLTISSNIEYCGDGPGSVIVGSNACLIGPNGAHFNVTGYGDFVYYPADAVNAGDRSVKATTPADAGHFAAGDIVMICSTGTNVSGLFYYMEVNRVLAADATTGILALEDVIEDGWALGLQIVNITGDVAQNYSVHDLALECPNGFPIIITASYKSRIRDLWTHGVTVMAVNCLTRSEVSNINGLVNWSGATKYAAIEVESGSVRANVHDIEISMYGSGGAGALPLIYAQEFTRRSRIADIRIAARGIAINDLIQLPTAGGHQIEGISLNAASMDTALRYSGVDPALSSHNGLPSVFRRIRVDLADGTGAFDNGIVFANVATSGKVENVTVEDVEIRGVTSGYLVLFAQGVVDNVVLSRVRGPGLINMATTGLSSADDPSSGTLAYPLNNVRFQDCEFGRIAHLTMLQQAAFTGCRRLGLPRHVFYPSTVPWTSSAANHVELSLPLASGVPLCWGDAIHVRVTGFIDAPQSALGAMHVRLVVFGTIVTTLDWAQGSASQDFEINVTISLVDGSFQAPDKWVVEGYQASNGVPQSRVLFIESLPGLPASVDVLAWTAGGAALIPKHAKIAFVPVEARASAGI